MCGTKQPKPKPTSEDQKKPVQYLSNPWVDGLGIVGTGARGRNSLRTDGTPRVTVNMGDPLPTTTYRPPSSGGSSGGGLAPTIWGRLGISNSQRAN